MAIHHSWFQSFVSKLFLDGLNQEFDLRRQLIFSKLEWPSLDDIVSSITEEGTRLADSEVSNPREPDARAALSIQGGNTSISQRNQGKKKYLFCDKCKREGHTIERCFKIHGYPPGWKKGRSQPGGAQGGKWSQANHTGLEGKLPVADMQALEEYKSKLRISEGMSSTQGSSTVDSSFHASSQGAKDRENSWDWDCA